MVRDDRAPNKIERAESESKIKDPDRHSIGATGSLISRISYKFHHDKYFDRPQSQCSKFLTLD